MYVEQLLSNSFKFIKYAFITFKFVFRAKVFFRNKKYQWRHHISASLSLFPKHRFLDGGSTKKIQTMSCGPSVRTCSLAWIKAVFFSRPGRPTTLLGRFLFDGERRMWEKWKLWSDPLGKKYRHDYPGITFCSICLFLVTMKIYCPYPKTVFPESFS